MSLLINNSRDIGNKFLFGHFMMDSSFAIPKSKRKPNFDKPWVYLTKKDKAKDYKLGGEVFVHPGKGLVKGNRTWRVMDGSNKKAKISVSEVYAWIAKEMYGGANGIAVWLDGWTHSKKFLEKVGKICKQYKIITIGFVESYAKNSDGKVPTGYDDFEDCAKALNDIFDYVIVYNFADNVPSFKDTIVTDWGDAGYKHKMGAIQDAYSRESEKLGKHGAFIDNATDNNGYAVWKNIAAWCVNSDHAFCLYDPEKVYKSENTSKRIKILKEIFKGTKTIPDWDKVIYGPGDDANPRGPGEGEDKDEEEDQTANPE